MSERIHWVPIESNPEVMNKFLSNIGVPNEWSIVDVIGLDEELLQFIGGPVLALILLFPVKDQKSDSTEDIQNQTKEEDLKNVYFMRQTIHNACGTIALIHSVANNCNRIQLKADSSLKAFLDSSQELSPEERGILLESNAEICSAHHNSAKEGQTCAPAADSEVNHHFVAIVEGNGLLYELGSKPYPVNHGKTSEKSFLSDAARVCRQYMAKDPNNLSFTVVALSYQN